jgi:hypothetical protein
VPLELMPGVDAAVSAGGYNSVTELMYAGVPSVLLPQPRIADDQDARARAAADTGAARIASSVEQVPALLDELHAQAGAAVAAARALVPRNGARAAAAEILATVLPAADVAMAQSIVSPELWARAQQLGSGAIEAIAAIAGDPPSVQKERDALLAELVAEGALVSAPARRRVPAAVRLDRFLTALEVSQPPIDTALSIVRTLRRKFPGASLDAVVDACNVLMPAWARFADWMGAVSLVNALPVQRTAPIGEVAEAMVTWLAGESDLFDALRRFARLEGNGTRTLPEVLRALPQALQSEVDA